MSIGAHVYGWIWRHLPGNAGSKALLSLLLVLLCVLVLFAVVFPGLEPLLRATPVTVGP